MNTCHPTVSLWHLKLKDGRAALSFVQGHQSKSDIKGPNTNPSGFRSRYLRHLTLHCDTNYPMTGFRKLLHRTKPGENLVHTC